MDLIAKIEFAGDYYEESVSCDIKGGTHFKVYKVYRKSTDKSGEYIESIGLYLQFPKTSRTYQVHTGKGKLLSLPNWIITEALPTSYRKLFYHILRNWPSKFVTEEQIHDYVSERGRRIELQHTINLEI